VRESTALASAVTSGRLSREQGLDVMVIPRCARPHGHPADIARSCRTAEDHELFFFTVPTVRRSVKTMNYWTEKPISVLLAPGFGGDPLHSRSPTRQTTGNLDLDRLPLSPQLKGELRAWEHLLRQAHAAPQTPAAERDLQIWATQARDHLLPRLREELGADYDVQFIGDLQST
jgi:hypothetical protein